MSRERAGLVVAPWPDHARHRHPASMLDRAAPGTRAENIRIVRARPSSGTCACHRGGWYRREARIRCRTTCAAITTPGTSHGGGAVDSIWPSRLRRLRAAGNPNPQFDTERALLVAFIDWV